MTVTMAPRSRAGHHQNLYSHIRQRARDMSSSHLPDVVLSAVSDRNQQQAADALAASVVPTDDDSEYLLGSPIQRTMRRPSSSAGLEAVHEKPHLRDAARLVLDNVVRSSDGSDSEMLSPQSD